MAQDKSNQTSPLLSPTIPAPPYEEAFHHAPSSSHVDIQSSPSPVPAASGSRFQPLQSTFSTLKNTFHSSSYAAIPQSEPDTSASSNGGPIYTPSTSAAGGDIEAQSHPVLHATDLSSIPLQPVLRKGEQHTHCAECTKLVLKRERMQHVQRLCFTFWGVVAMFIWCAMIFGMVAVKAKRRKQEQDNKPKMDLATSLQRQVKSSNFLLGAVSPLLQSVLEVLKNYLGIDVSSVYALVLLAGLARYSSSLFNRASNFLRNFLRFLCIRKVVVEDESDLFDCVLGRMKATAYGQRFWDLTCYSANPEHDQLESTIRQNLDGWINFKSWEASTKVAQDLFPGRYWFRYGRQLFRVDRRVLKEAGANSRDDSAKECLVISILGFSTKPIQDFLEFCSRRQWGHKVSQTTVKRARTEAFISWRTVAVRDNRPLDTVVLGKGIKEKVLTDMNEFLLPSTERWYANRGIPHRRGYLFHGSPGTGKTSFAYSIAGFFGLSIYCISLADPSLTDSFLAILFDDLPSRCIVLMEDVDTSGLEKRNLESKKKNKATNEEKDTNGEDGNKTKSELTLSGLLNVLDGVAAKEGRILIMTTNLINKLDDALIRAGRIDMFIEFHLSDRAAIVDIFKRIYKPDDPVKIAADGLATRAIGTDTEQAVSEFELHKMALSFAEKLPEYKLSQAKVQGFLLERKKNSKKAVEEAEELVKEVREEESEKEKKAEEGEVKDGKSEGEVDSPVITSRWRPFGL